MVSPPSPCKGILLLSAGSKVAIARIAKAAARRRGLALHVTDTRENVPTRAFTDLFHRLPESSDAAWPELLLEYCARHAIGLVIPTRHSDLLPLSCLREKLRERQIALSLSQASTLALCLDKLATRDFLRRIEAPIPETTSKAALAQSSLAGRFPLFAKPAHGAAAVGARLARNAAELALIPEDWVLQRVATGQEYTINLYLSTSGEPLCAIPHERIAVESGEVMQAQTRRIRPLIDEALRIARALPGAEGILNLQAFFNQDTGELAIIEINPRIGGGYPLCDAAKGHYLEWLCQEHLDGDAPPRFDAWTENLLMMRYREAVFRLE